MHVQGVIEGHAVYAGYQTRTLTTGGSGPTLVLVHGFMDSCETWRGVLEVLAECGRAAIAVDLPGFGAADPLRGGSILDALAVFLDDVVKTEERHRGPVVVVGNSLGGLATIGLLRHHPRVAGVVLVEAPASNGSHKGDLLRSPRMIQLLSHLPIPWPVFRASMVTFIPWVAGPSSGSVQAHHATIDRMVAWAHAQGGFRPVAGQLARIATEGRRQALPATHVTTLIVHGGGRLVPLDWSRTLHASLPGSELLVVDDWSHCPQLDDPETVASLFGRFVDGLSKPAEVADDQLA